MIYNTQKKIQNLLQNYIQFLIPDSCQVIDMIKNCVGPFSLRFNGDDLQLLQLYTFDSQLVVQFDASILSYILQLTSFLYSCTYLTSFSYSQQLYELVQVSSLRILLKTLVSLACCNKFSDAVLVISVPRQNVQHNVVPFLTYK